MSYRFLFREESEELHFVLQRCSVQLFKVNDCRFQVGHICPLRNSVRHYTEYLLSDFTTSIFKVKVHFLTIREKTNINFVYHRQTNIKILKTKFVSDTSHNLQTSQHRVQAVRNNTPDFPYIIRKYFFCLRVSVSNFLRSTPFINYRF